MVVWKVLPVAPWWLLEAGDLGVISVPAIAFGNWLMGANSPHPQTPVSMVGAVLLVPVWWDLQGASELAVCRAQI